MRRVDEAIEPLAPGQPPRAFRWRGRRYVVHTVLTHWVETGAWWRSAVPAPGATAEGTAGGSAEGPAEPVPDGERALWRVETGSRNGLGSGVLDLCLDRQSAVGAEPGATGWSVRHVHD